MSDFSFPRLQSSKSLIRALPVISGKGGTGKSVITACLGYTLANLGFRTLIIDADMLTGGVSFFLSAASHARSSVGLRDVLFSTDNTVQQLTPIEMPHAFCDGNLFLIPAILSFQKLRVTLDSPVAPTRQEIEKVLDELLAIADRDRFQYVVFDTHGGIDTTCLAAAKVAGAVLFITEVGQTSWHVGGMLLDSINNLEGRPGEIRKRGFILNKNVMDVESIKATLISEWGMPHLATIPLARSTVRYFQTKKVPIAESVTDPFSASLIPVIRTLFWSETWGRDSTNYLGDLEYQARGGTQAAKKRQQMRAWQSLIRTGALLVIFGLLIIITSRIQSRGNVDFAEGTLALAAAFIGLVVTLADPDFLFQLIRLVYRSVPDSEASYPNDQ